jgi:hypothetical protein
MKVCLPSCDRVLTGGQNNFPIRFRRRLAAATPMNINMNHSKGEKMAAPFAIENGLLARWYGIADAGRQGSNLELMAQLS